MDFKHQLHNHCHQLVDERIALANKLINEAQQAANLESKSSVGDKYETGRAMMMHEREKAEAQLQEALKLKKVLNQISPEKTGSKVELGSYIETSSGNYYLVISLGKVEVDAKEVFVLSPVSPLGAQLVGKQVGERFDFNARSFEVKSIK